jgi:hypothetical protein
VSLFRDFLPAPQGCKSIFPVLHRFLSGTGGDLLSAAPFHTLFHPRGYTRKVRSVPASVKRQVFAEYFGRVPGMPGHYEINRLISLELGGSNDPKNLRPESYYTEPFNAHVKDKLEDHMAANVRKELKKHGHNAAAVLLKQYQKEIATDWVAAYHRYVSATP